MNKKTIIKWSLIAAGLIGAYLIFGPKAEAAVGLELGQYEKRIDGGLYTSDEANYVKASTSLGVIGGLSVTGDFEYVDTDSYQLYSTLGTSLDTPLGALSAGVLISTIEDGDSSYEFVGAYDVSLFGIDAVTGFSIEEDGQYTADISAGTTVYANDLVTVSLGAEYGKSFGYATDYDYTLGFARLETSGELKLFAQVNYLQNDLYSDDYEKTSDVGVAFSF